MRSKKLEEYKKQLRLTAEQNETLFGTLLGDAHLETRNGGRTYRVKFEQSKKHEAYVQHLYQVFRPWVRTPPQERQVTSRGHVSCNLWFQTLSHGAFRFFAQQFVPEEKKIVPSLIHRWLTPRALAYWFMDDGSVKSKESKGVILNTQSYPLSGVDRLCEALSDNFELKAKPRKQLEGYQIYISGNSYERFKSLVEQFVIPEMRYKIPPARQTHLPKE